MIESAGSLIKKNFTIAWAFGTLISFIIAYYPVFRILVGKWADSEEYSHAFLTLPIILYMVYEKRDQILETGAQCPVVGLVIVIFSTVLYFFSLLTEVHTIIALAMYLTVIGALVFLFGVQILGRLFTPLLLFFMLIPVPDQLYIQLTFPLQLKVSQVSAAIITLFDIPVFRTGNVITISEKSFEVVEACSGLHSVITLLTLSVIMGYFMLSRVTSKLMMVAASIPIAIFINLVRVVAIVLLFHFFRIDIYEGTWHTITGLLIFLVALTTLFMLQRILELWEQKKK